MAKLIYATNTSLDGYIEDKTGGFSWSEPDEELHRFFGGLVASAGTLLYGRRLYETMSVWETDPALAEMSPMTRDFAEQWRAPAKVVYSRSLREPSTERTTIERVFDAEAVRAMKDSADRDLFIGGAELASHALRAGIVDEYVVAIAPVVVGGGKAALPDDVFLELEQLEARRFPGGAVLLRYAIR